MRTDAGREIRHAVEVRNKSFASSEFVDLLRSNGVAMVVSDTGGKFPMFTDCTADFVYVRLHGPGALYSSNYSVARLKRWAEAVDLWSAGDEVRVKGDIHLGAGERSSPHGSSVRDVYVYFDNDAKVHAPFNAHDLSQHLRGSA